MAILAIVGGGVVLLIVPFHDDNMLVRPPDDSTHLSTEGRPENTTQRFQRQIIGDLPLLHHLLVTLQTL